MIPFLISVLPPEPRGITDAAEAAFAQADVHRG